MLAGFLWPLARILACIAIAPPLGNNSIPVPSKILLGVTLAMIVAPNIAPPNAVDMLSLPGILVLCEQIIIGLAMGFVIRLVFAGVEMAGEISGLTMGLGFATFFDPQTRGRSSAISQLLVILVTLLFLALDIHHLLFQALVMSFQSFPLDVPIQGHFQVIKLVLWGEEVFKIGVLLSLPIVAALLIANVALGILTRAAPQLNLFGIGFPITIGLGFLMLNLSLAYFVKPIEQIFQSALVFIQTLL